MNVAVPEGEEDLVGGLYKNVVSNRPCKLILTGLQELGKTKPFNRLLWYDYVRKKYLKEGS